MAQPVPVTERGYTTLGGLQWWSLVDDEPTPELLWPRSIGVYDRMRRQDSQVKSVLGAVTLPIRRTPWRIDPAGARDEVVQLVAEDLGLPIVGVAPTPAPRTRDRFSWLEHLRLALLMLTFGHSVFEQVYRIDGSRARLRKLGWRPPSSIANWNVAADGGLVSIEQLGRSNATTPTIIPMDRLVVYVNEREGGNWIGQALATDTPVPTPDGWREVGELKIGDRVFDEQGKIRHVVARRDWSDRPCFRVQFGDGSSIVADENHQWISHTFAYRSRGRGAPSLVTTAEMGRTISADAKAVSNHAIPVAGAVEYVRQRQIVDPYVLGYWLGDGQRASGRIVTLDEEVAEMFGDRGYPCIKSKGWETNRSWQVKGLATDLRYLGVIENKHVPDEYMRGSIEQRLELLRGLMDSDGTITKHGQCVFSNTDKVLSSAVLEIVRSLGIRATRSLCKQAGSVGVLGSGKEICSRRDVWRVNFATHLPVFGLSRKAIRLADDNQRRRYHIVKAVTPVARRDTVCIEVDSPSHLFLAGESFVASHNSLLRPGYKDWLLKDRLLRVDVGTIERNGMGIPVYEAADGEEDLTAGKTIATSVRAGDNSGAATPFGAKLRLMGVEGTLPEALPSIRYHDEQIARGVLAHFLNLGTQTGSWALGTTFADFFVSSLNAVADDIAEVASQHIVEDLVDINFGPDEPAPRVIPDEIGSKQIATAQALKSLFDAGILRPDRSLEEAVRQTYDLPSKDTSAPTQPWAPPTT